MLRGILIHLTQYLPRYLGISSETVANGFPNAPETEDCSNCSVLTTRSHVGSNALIPLLASVVTIGFIVERSHFYAYLFFFLFWDNGVTFLESRASSQRSAIELDEAHRKSLRADLWRRTVMVIASCQQTLLDSCEWLRNRTG
jgi:hypothetical protein